MAFQEITDVDQMLALREVGLLWVSGGDTRSNIPPGMMISRAQQAELVLVHMGCTYYVLLED